MIASAILQLISESMDIELEMVDPRYVKFSTTSIVHPSMVMLGEVSVSCAVMFVLFRLLVNPNSFQAKERRVTSCIVSEKELTNEYFNDFGLGVKTG